MIPLKISDYTITNSLGPGKEASLQGLKTGLSGLSACDFPHAELETWIGRVEGLEEQPLEGELARFDCRNNRLAKLGLDQDHFREHVADKKGQAGAQRVGVFIGTSTSGNTQLEQAYRHRAPETGALPEDFDYQHTLNMFSPAQFIRESFGLEGPALSISTACSSSAKAFVAAYRHIRAGLCDSAIVGGVDSLCLTTLYGFNSLSLVSSNPCRPWDTGRDGINIGEAAGFALVELTDPPDEGISLIGYGESSDAHHMTAPHPEGLGAMLSMRQALQRAGMEPEQVDYINLHGTATPFNDELEDKAVVEVFGSQTPCSSTKGFTGHTLGAAGILESVYGFMAMEHGFLPSTLNTREVDSELNANIVLETVEQPVRVVMNNSFGFGGNNCSLMFGRVN